MDLKIKRISSGLTQKQLRDKSKVGMNTIVALEKGKIDGVRVLTLKKIARALNCSVEELFFSKD